MSGAGAEVLTAMLAEDPPAQMCAPDPQVGALAMGAGHPQVLRQVSGVGVRLDHLSLLVPQAAGLHAPGCPRA